MGLFEHRRSLEEMQEEDEQLTSEVSIAKKRALIRELKLKYGSGYAKAFSDNGKASGMNFGRIVQWLKSH